LARRLRCGLQAAQHRSRGHAKARPWCGPQAEETGRLARRKGQTVMAAVVLGVMFSMSSVAAALGGGAAATASGAIGRLASLGAGAGRMLTTGHSKRPLTSNNNVIGKAVGSTTIGAGRAANYVLKKGLEMARKKIPSAEHRHGKLTFATR